MSKRFKVTPGGLAEFFYSNSTAEPRCIGHLRGDFGSQGRKFWTTWWPHAAEGHKTAEFKAEFQDFVNTLRKSLLKDLPAMFKYIADHPVAPIEDTSVRSYGYHVITGKYAYYVRCTPAPGQYHFYIYCYLKGDE